MVTIPTLLIQTCGRQQPCPVRDSSCRVLRLITDSPSMIKSGVINRGSCKKGRAVPLPTGRCCECGHFSISQSAGCVGCAPGSLADWEGTTDLSTYRRPGEGCEQCNNLFAMYQNEICFLISIAFNCRVRNWGICLKMGGKGRKHSRKPFQFVCKFIVK